MKTQWITLCAALVGALLFLSATNAGAQSVSVLSNISPGAFSSNPSQLVAAGSDLCFLAVLGADVELWCSDGTDAGTRNVTDSTAGTHFFAPFGGLQVAAAGSTRFVSGDRGTIDFELYAISDTDVVTAIDIHPTGGSSPQDLFGYGNILLFSADDGVNGRELWRSDGTPGGTFMLGDLLPGPGSSAPAEFALVGGEVYFGTLDGVGGTELWKTDGSALGTVHVADVASGSNATRPMEIVDLQGIAVFVVAVNNFATLMRSDGTPGGTSTILTFSSPPADLRAIGGSVYFSAPHITAGTELWISDGSPSGTMLLSDLSPVSTGTFPAFFTDLGNVVLFRARLGFGADHELWRTEGSDATTERVLEINVGGPDEVSDLRGLGGLVYFAASNGPDGIELWQSDGTANGTFQTADLAAPGGSFPRELTVFDGRLYFVATSSADGREVFVLEPPLVPILSPPTLGLLFMLLAGMGSLALSKSDVALMFAARELGRKARSAL